MRVEFHPSTVDDVNEAASHYGRARTGLGAEFRAEIEAVVDRIARDPSQFPIVETHIRRCIVHRFPYSVLYRIVGTDLVRILVIRHHRRHPQFGLNRA